MTSALDRSDAAPAPGREPTGARPPRWLVAAAAGIVLALIGAGLVWRHRVVVDAQVATELLAVPDHPTGPIPAASTAAGTGEPTRTLAQRWDAARTGGDDRQLVVFFDGGGCGVYRADVDEQADAVAISIFAVDPADGTGCNAMLVGQAIGIPLAAPLGNRRLVGFRPLDGTNRTEPLVVPGEELVTLTWPPGAERAASEELVREVIGADFLWTQRFGGTSDPSLPYQPVVLEQWRGAGPVDAAVFGRACQAILGITSAPVEVDGTPATLVRCPSGSLAVVWVLDRDRLVLRADPGTLGIDETSIVELAASVRRGA